MHKILFYHIEVSIFIVLGLYILHLQEIHMMKQRALIKINSKKTKNKKQKERSLIKYIGLVIMKFCKHEVQNCG